MRSGRLTCIGGYAEPVGMMCVRGMWYLRLVFVDDACIFYKGYSLGRCFLNTRMLREVRCEYVRVYLCNPISMSMQS